MKVPTKSSFVCAAMSSLKVSNNTPNDSGRYDRESLSNIRFHTLGLCVSTPEHVLIGKTDVNVTIAIESTHKVLRSMHHSQQFVVQYHLSISSC